jgi:hypothetical protein
VRGGLSTKDFIRRAIALGERMFLAGEIARREAVSTLEAWALPGERAIAFITGRHRRLWWPRQACFQ